MNYVLLGAMFMHFVGDFVLQTPGMAKNKSKRIMDLVAHVTVYTLVMVVSLIFYTQSRYQYGPHVTIPLWCSFAALIFVSHIAVDFVTSRITSIIFESAMRDLKDGYDNRTVIPKRDYDLDFSKKYHEYFVVIGFDQFLHFASILLIITALDIN